MGLPLGPNLAFFSRVPGIKNFWKQLCCDTEIILAPCLT